MQVIAITDTERICLSRSQTNTIAQLQIKVDGKWKNEFRKPYSGDWKGLIIDDMTVSYAEWKRHQVYQQQLSEPYH